MLNQGVPKWCIAVKFQKRKIKKFKFELKIKNVLFCVLPNVAPTDTCSITDAEKSLKETFLGQIL
jgi:hypothetical protein